MSNFYISEPRQIAIWMDRIPTYQQFNAIMESHGCPVEADAESNTQACLLAAFDWLATRTKETA